MGVKHAGSPNQQGYRVEEGQHSRRRTALNKAFHEYGYKEVAEKLNALAVIDRHHKEKSRHLQDDFEYLLEKFRNNNENQ